MAAIGRVDLCSCPPWGSQPWVGGPGAFTRGTSHEVLSPWSKSAPRGAGSFQSHNWGGEAGVLMVEFQSHSGVEKQLGNTGSLSLCL